MTQENKATFTTYEVRVYPDRTEWRLNGLLHREDGPACEYANGDKSWWINGQLLTEEEFSRQRSFCENKVVKIDGKKYKLVEVK